MVDPISLDNLDLKEKEYELERNKWRGRRKMGWIALLSMLTFTLILLFAPISNEKLNILSETITWFYFAMTSIIGAYMGVTAWANVKGK